MRIDGSTFLVTGTSRGIGEALVGELADRGARVLAGRRDEARPAGSRPGVGPVRIDLTSPESIDVSCDELGTDLQGVDALINNAGRFTAGQLELQDVGEIYIVAYAHFPGVSTYSASKAAVSAFTECLRRELKGTGVSTLEVITGGVDTDMLGDAAGRLDGHSNPSAWQWMAPTEWAARIVDAIERDEQTLQPPGRSRVAKTLSAAPSFVMDAVAARGFRRG